MINQTVYLLCFFTSLMCSFLLYRGYRQGGAQMLLWSSVCFAGLAFNNMMLVIDLMIFPGIDLSLPRNLVGLAASTSLLYNLVWGETTR